ANPEFLKEGAAVEDFMKPDRVIVGVDSPEAAQVIGELYAPFVRTGNPIIFMDLASAEMTKYAANAMLATRISFMNQIARLCDAVGADVTAAVWGLAFKAESDDVRESPALVLVEQLLEAGARVRVHDPAAMDTARHHLGDRVTYAGTAYGALEGAAALVIVTEWLEYRNPDFGRIKQALSRPLI